MITSNEFLPNCPCIARALSLKQQMKTKCVNGIIYQGENKRNYSKKICRAIREGLCDQTRINQEFVEEVVSNLDDGRKIDEDLAGKQLPTTLVIEATKLEIEYYWEMSVYTKVPHEESMRCAGKASIRVRRVDVNRVRRRSQTRRSLAPKGSRRYKTGLVCSNTTH